MAHIGAQILWLNMNLDEPWELQPWHARIGLRNMGIVCPDEAIQLPSQPIRGPNLDIQHKVFAIKVTVSATFIVSLFFQFLYIYFFLWELWGYGLGMSFPIIIIESFLSTNTS